MIETGFLIFGGIALLLAKLPRRTMLRALKHDLAIDLHGDRPAGQPDLVQHRRQRAICGHGSGRSVDDDRGGRRLGAAHGTAAPPRGRAISSGSNSAITAFGEAVCCGLQGMP